MLACFRFLLFYFITFHVEFVSFILIKSLKYRTELEQTYAAQIHDNVIIDIRV